MITYLTKAQKHFTRSESEARTYITLLGWRENATRNEKTTK
jgi:hypothetical protein